MIEELSLAPAAPQILPREFREVHVDLAELVSGYSLTLFRVAHSVLRNRDEAEDVVQDVFVRVLQHRHALPSIRDLRVWLVRIAWNLAMDRRRKVRPEQMNETFAIMLTANVMPADIALHEAERLQAVFRFIEALPKAERQALLLSAIDELTTSEIAGVMKKSESAVRALLFRARSHLRRRIEKAGLA